MVVFIKTDRCLIEVWNSVFMVLSVIPAAKVKNIRRGVKEVQKFINKGEKG